MHESERVEAHQRTTEDPTASSARSGALPSNSRRRWLLLSGVLAGVSSLAVWLLSRPGSDRRLPETSEAEHDRRLDTTLRRELLDEVGYLKIDSDGLDSYLQAYAAFIRKEPQKDRKEDIVRRFLLSFDFFQNGGDEARLLHFVAFYHPYSTPCYQPIAHAPQRARSSEPEPSPG